MSNTYFLAVALPESDLESPLEIDFEEVDTLLRENLSANDYRKVETFSLGESAFLKRLRQFEDDFLKETVAFRRERLKRPGPYGEAEKLPGLHEILDKFYSAPLLLHKALLEYRLNSMQGAVEDPFSLDQILWKVWRLKEIEKWRRLDRGVGLEKLDEILRRIA